MGIAKVPTLVEKVRNSVQVLSRDITDLSRRRREYKECQPRFGFLFLTYRCTSRCRTCSMWRRSYRSEQELGQAQWRKVAEKLHEAGVRVVEVYGGDVFLRKDVLIPFLHHLKGLKMTVHMPINGILLSEELASSVVATGLDRIYISMDHLHRMHDRIRGVNGNYAKIVSAMKYLVEARGTASKPTFVCITTISRENIRSIPQIIGMAHQMGFDVFEFGVLGEIDKHTVAKSSVNGIHPDPFFSKDGDSLLPELEDVEWLKSQVGSLKRKYHHTSTLINSTNYDICTSKELSSGHFGIRNCYQGRSEITVDPYGNVLACPFFPGYTLGNLLKDSVESIWRSEKLHLFRRRQGNGMLEICQHCVLPIPRNCDLGRGLRNIFYNRIYDKLVTM